MSKVNHRYLRDNNEEIYFPKVHVEALIGIEDKNSTNPFGDINEKLEKMNTLITQANKTIAEQKKLIDFFDVALGDMIGNTGWIDIDVPPTMKNNAVSTGFKCGIREVRAGSNLIPHSFVVRSIRLNVSGITGNSMQIAQLPTGFITNNQSFMARGQGYRHPVTIECLNNGKVMAFVHPDDQKQTNWVYQEFTWLE
ncbi:hypothetical protein [Staphylococcus equorum]|uniref:Uncharacterized protein n=1 Tax=Staphylococcus equorum TaxID=246432 RepID=A0A9X4LC20_9STAP|nr:hypothetical protein [Staphylococcus equorum]MDG0860331.1 hypothetical protein [Staphylococcus equorum]